MSTGHRVYIGRLARDARRRDLEDLFKDFGRILDVTVKTGFGFVEFENKVDAEDAVHDIHDTKFLGQTIVVELAMSRRREQRPEVKDTNRVIVKNLPSKTTWQDLKDYMRKAGRVTFADILKDQGGEGVVEFAKREDMKYALRQLDGGRLNGARVTIEEAGRRSRRSSRDRSRSPRRISHRRSRTRSASRSRSRSPRSRSRSPRRSRSRSSSRGRSPQRRGDDEEEIKKEDVIIDVPVVKSEEDDIVMKRARSRSRSRSSLDERD